MIRALAVAGLAALAAGTPGTPDPSFGNGGVVTYLSGVSVAPPTLAPATDGGFVLLGQKRFGEGAFIVRYDRDGKLVRGFGRGGVARARGFVGLQNWGAARPLPGGDELVMGDQAVGVFDQYVLVARFRPDGSLNSHLGRRGRLRQRFGTKGCTEEQPVAALEQGPKTVLLASACPPRDLRSFAGRGYVTFHRGREARVDPLSGVFELGDGSILAVACLSDRAPVLYRISARGLLEGSTVASQVHGCLSIALQIGNDVVGGSNDAVVRMTPDGDVVWSAPTDTAGSAVLEEAGEIITAASFDPARDDTGARSRACGLDVDQVSAGAV